MRSNVLIAVIEKEKNDKRRRKIYKEKVRLKSIKEIMVIDVYVHDEENVIKSLDSFCQNKKKKDKIIQSENFED